MTGSRKVAALAATLLAAAVPLQASEVNAPAITASYTNHAIAAPDIAALIPEPAVVDGDAPAPEQPAAPKPLRALVDDFAAAETPDSEIDCLAIAVYFEAKSEPLAGQLAVAEVVVNRAKSGRFPATLCGVVKQRSQFSFVRGGVLPSAPRASTQWRTAVAIARIAAEELHEPQVDDRTMFFHARHVAPAWRGRVRMASIGNHIFYR